MRPKNVFLVCIDLHYSKIIYVSKTRGGALSRLHAFVDTWWLLELGAKKMPVDKQKAVDIYFKNVAKKTCPETYAIRETRLWP